MQLRDTKNPTDVLGHCDIEEEIAMKFGINLKIEFEHLPKGPPMFERLIAKFVFDSLEAMNYYRVLDRYRPSEDIRFVVG